MPQGQSNTAIIRRWIDDVWNQRRDATVHELLDPNAIGHLEGLVTHNVDEFLKARAYLLDAFPDFHIEIDAMIAEGDNVVARWSASGTHGGELLGIKATGKDVRIRGITWFRLANGRLVEGWDVWNEGRLFETLQAGARGQPATAA